MNLKSSNHKYEVIWECIRYGKFTLQPMYIGNSYILAYAVMLFVWVFLMRSYDAVELVKCKTIRING